MARKFSIEEMELEADRAAEAAAKSESTDPGDITLVANYRDEIEKLREESGDADADGGGGSDDPDAAGGESSGDGAGDAGGAAADTGGSSGDDPKSTEEPTPTEAPSSDEGEEPEEGSDEPPEGETAEPTKEATEALEHAMETVVALHRVHAIVRRAQATGGLTQPQVRHVQFTLEALASKVGCPVPVNYSLEAFDSYSTRERETGIVLESIGAVMQRIWDNVRRFFAALFNWVREWLFGAKKQAVEQQKTIKEVQVLVKQAAAKPELPEEVKERIKQKLYRQYSRNLLTKEGDGDVDDVMRGITQFIKMYGDVANFIEGPMVPVVERCMMAFDTQDPQPDALMVAFHRKDFGSMSLKQIPSDMGSVASGMFAGVIGPLPGGSYTLVQAYQDAGKPSIETLPEQRLVVDYQHDKMDGGIALCPDKKALLEVEQTISNFAKKTPAFYASVGKNYAEIEEFIKALLTEVDQGQWTNKSPEETAALVQLITLNNKVIQSFMIRTVVGLQVYSDRTIHSLLDYLSACSNAVLSSNAPKVGIQPAT